MHHGDGSLLALVRGTGPMVGELMSLIEQEMDTLGDWFGVEFTDVALPCPHCYLNRSPVPYYFPIVLCEIASAQDLKVQKEEVS